MRYTYDNWSYNPDKTKTYPENVEEGFKKANEYINWHCNKFGDTFFYVIVASLTMDYEPKTIGDGLYQYTNPDARKENKD